MQQDQGKKVIKEMDFFTEYGDANRYRILEVIGKGSYGVVCAAIDTHTGEKVAIKKITDVFEHISDAIRILREVKLLRLLRHPDIVEIKGIMLPPSKREFKDIYVVFELMESDLHQVIKANDDLTREHHQFFLYQMLRALKYMHTANVYHRDLKPKNILANANCKLKVCDLGLARVAFSDTPTTVFWTDYVATRWYRAPELCGSFFSKYTPAIDIWSTGCIFAEVLMGKPLFPGKSVVDQLELITDLLGTPSPETISGVRNEKARKYLNGMRKKNPIPFSQKFPNLDPLALRLLQRLLAFDPKDRPTATEALADPYFKGLAKVEREPSCQPISKLEFEFERRRLTKDGIRELIYREILEYHPQLLKDYMNGSEGSNFVYPSAIGHLKKQFAYLEENSSRSGPVIPPERKHVSLPRPTVHSSLVRSSITQSNFNTSESQRVSGEASKHSVVPGHPSSSTNSTKSLGPPPRVPSGRSGHVESSAPYEYGRSLKEAYDGRTYHRNAVLPPQTVSPHCYFRTNLMNPEKRGIEASQPKPQYDPQCQPNKPPAPNTMAVEMNPNPYFQSQPNQLSNGQMGIDAKLLQAQSQYGAAGAAAVAVAAHRNMASVRYGTS
ncbi:PREDICTED: mitogen-activated protein kinase 19-like [Tarenaya hassleriana]|uniref:mitogen-activated protein kinase 19-like n=1 Tax=Tarenaya hassleriana TaxID=28532 RepID=UPI00053CA13B|nr:PREDICTED: mitogen-activated protein kinase 19-like [Tarenaya hassleriana]XP_019059119.1 PREDICTED: mitogen-activated protein kinase 19-like [Tarenaya hassleriana]